MRAINILFDEIDKLNSQIKSEENAYRKIFLAFKIGKVVGIIKEIEELRMYSGDEKCI